MSSSQGSYTVVQTSIRTSAVDPIIPATNGRSWNIDGYGSDITFAATKSREPTQLRACRYSLGHNE